MKIAIETLQQKLEDKEKEKAQIRLEYKNYIAELKQDKKRYEELLLLRDHEMHKMTDNLSRL